jgi:hypothetical protein
LLREASQEHDEIWLAREIRARNLLQTHEEAKKPAGGTTRAAVPVTAADTLAEGQFNRFYARGLCARAVEQGTPHVEVYRGKSVVAPRAESDAKLGQRIAAAALLQDLRTSRGVEPALGMPPGRHSGLSIRLPRQDAVATGSRLRTT